MVRKSKAELEFRKKHKIPKSFNPGGFFKEGTKLAPHYIVIRSGYTEGPHKWRAIGHNFKTGETEVAT